MGREDGTGVGKEVGFEPKEGDELKTGAGVVPFIVGDIEGRGLGFRDGRNDGAMDGVLVGASVGDAEGFSVGNSEGDFEGIYDGE